VRGWLKWDGLFGYQDPVTWLRGALGSCTRAISRRYSSVLRPGPTACGMTLPISAGALGVSGRAVVWSVIPRRLVRKPGSRSRQCFAGALFVPEGRVGHPGVDVAWNPEVGADAREQLEQLVALGGAEVLRQCALHFVG
jgi:hypothetical protein